MPSTARTRLDIVLADVDAHIAHARSFAAGRRGAPAAVAGVKRPGRPFTRAATVLLAGAMEGYVEAVALETAGAMSFSPQQLSDFKRQVDMSHGVTVRHLHQITAVIGLPFVADEIGWNGLSQGGVRQLLVDLSSRRNKIAHGAAPDEARVSDVERWRKLCVRFADELDKKCAAAVQVKTGALPW
ncbi:hypothetical protein [Pseudoclavibacter sp. AY1H1]|uniref:hypothetical protein n=1 Tax=Pseudoclavibacter sp. AY1H1 TaxID=2080584 RepID=UPI0011B02A31|nr:hypothetical protein [Pseudoclavibacter sp. AY1H1]